MKHEEALKKDSDDAIVVECDLEEPPEKVWQALTTPEIVAEWLMPNNMQAHVGARFSFSENTNTLPGPRHTAGAQVHPLAGKIECEVLECKPPRRLSYRWREELGAEDGDSRAMESVVTFVLTGRTDGGTHLRVVHDEFELTTLAPTAMQTVTLWPRYARRRRTFMRRRRAFTASACFTLHSRTRRAA